MLVTFSLLRNWYRLNSKSKNEISMDLRPIHAIRFLSMVLVIMSHCALFINVLPVLNPQYMEGVSLIAKSHTPENHK